MNQDFFHCSANTKATLPWYLRALPYKYIRKQSQLFNERDFIKEVKKQRTFAPVVVYLWPNASINLHKELRQLNIPIAREMINCHRRMAREIITSEYKRLGIKQTNAISEKSVELETESLRYCDLVFCSNQYAEESVLADGILASKNPFNKLWMGSKTLLHNK
jgi:hypothetical protein